MLDVFALGVAMAVGQARGADPVLIPPPELPRYMAIPQTGQLGEMPPALGAPALPPRRVLPQGRVVVNTMQAPPVAPIAPAAPKLMPAAPGTAPAPVVVTPAPAVVVAPSAPVYTVPYQVAPAEPAKPEAEKPLFTSLIAGTGFGNFLEERKISISGWTAMSYNFSQNDVTNQPVVWNDRPNKFLLQQHWTRIEKAIDTESKEATWGYRADILFGTDYRFTLPRGLLNSQLENSNFGNQNLYGVDPIQFYVNTFLPNLFGGTEIKVGRLYTPWGSESLEAPTTPLMSRSYAFNWSPPFTHVGIQANVNLSKQLAGKFMLANGNDVFIDPAQELRFIGALTYTTEDKKDDVTLGWSIGRGKFNAGDPYNPSTIGLQTEPAGRNNFNAFDFVWNHQISDKLKYGFEAIYGYQTGVPANVPGGIISTGVDFGSAYWGSLVNYFTYNINDKTTSILRIETFDDFNGQRTGFEGLYYAATLGVQYKPKDSIIFRPEIRYDRNDESTPFEGRHSLVTFGADLIFKW